MIYNDIGIIGIGSYIPSKIITNKQIEDLNIGTSDEWITSTLGIKERRIIGQESIMDMGYYAAINCMENSFLKKDNIDLIIVSTSSRNYQSPSVASFVANQLGLKRNIPVFDINAVCSGFIYGVMTACSFIESKVYENVLVISTEAYSTITDWSDRNCVFFGDGAGAVLLKKVKDNSITCQINSDSNGNGITGFVTPINSTFRMNGNDVFKKAIEVLPESILSILRDNNMSINDIDIWIPHQSNKTMIHAIADRVGLNYNKIKIILDRYGNQASASIPIALNEVLQTDNKIILMTTIGSGWTWGNMILKKF